MERPLATGSDQFVECEEDSVELVEVGSRIFIPAEIERDASAIEVGRRKTESKKVVAAKQHKDDAGSITDAFDPVKNIARAHTCWGPKEVVCLVEQYVFCPPIANVPLQLDAQLCFGLRLTDGYSWADEDRISQLFKHAKREVFRRKTTLLCRCCLNLNQRYGVRWSSNRTHQLAGQCALKGGFPDPGRSGDKDHFAWCSKDGMREQARLQVSKARMIDAKMANPLGDVVRIHDRLSEVGRARRPAVGAESFLTDAWGPSSDLCVSAVL